MGSVNYILEFRSKILLNNKLTCKIITTYTYTYTYIIIL